MESSFFPTFESQCAYIGNGLLRPGMSYQELGRLGQVKIALKSVQNRPGRDPLLDLTHFYGMLFPSSPQKAFAEAHLVGTLTEGEQCLAPYFFDWIKRGEAKIPLQVEPTAEEKEEAYSELYGQLRGLVERVLPELKELFRNRLRLSENELHESRGTPDAENLWEQEGRRQGMIVSKAEALLEGFRADRNPSEILPILPHFLHLAKDVHLMDKLVENRLIFALTGSPSKQVQPIWEKAHQELLEPLPGAFRPLARQLQGMEPILFQKVGRVVNDLLKNFTVPVELEELPDQYKKDLREFLAKAKKLIQTARESLLAFVREFDASPSLAVNQKEFEKIPIEMVQRFGVTFFKVEGTKGLVERVESLVQKYRIDYGRGRILQEFKEDLIERYPILRRQVARAMLNGERDEFLDTLPKQTTTSQLLTYAISSIQFALEILNPIE